MVKLICIVHVDDLGSPENHADEILHEPELARVILVGHGLAIDIHRV